MAEDGEPIHHGVIYVAPPDQHLLVKKGHVRVTRGPRENRVRPAIDPLFRSAAAAYGAQVIGVILTGYQDDGTAGLLAVKRCGGIAVVQDPQDAPYPEMPKNALAQVEVDYRLPLAHMGVTLEFLVGEEVKHMPPIPEDIILEAELAERVSSNTKTEKIIGEPVPFGCPECGGPVWEIATTPQARYRCHMGHAFTAQALLTDQAEALERALWVALRTLEERVSLLKKLAKHEREYKGGKALSTQRYEEEADEVKGHADLIRELLHKGV
jgi:two-component system chemotaxis response regulator CheB